MQNFFIEISTKIDAETATITIKIYIMRLVEFLHWLYMMD